MPIIIPSKHIYSKQINLVNDNQINSVNVEVQTPSIITQTEPVATQTCETFMSLQGRAAAKAQVPVSTVGKLAYVGCVYAEKVTYTGTIGFKIPKLSLKNENKLIMQLITGLSEEGTPNISYTIYGEHKKGNVTLDYSKNTPYVVIENTNYDVQDAEIYNVSAFICNTDTATTEDNVIYTSNDLKSALSYTIPEYTTNDLGEYNKEITVTVGLAVDETVCTAEPKDYGDYFNLVFDIFAGLKCLHIPFVAQDRDSDGRFEYVTTIDDISGTGLEAIFEEYTPKSVEITINGVTIGLDLQSNTVTVGNGSKSFSIKGNELIQPTIKSEIRYQELIDEWENGKRTAKISCPITDYYDENGNKVIDISTSDKMLFDIGDIVIPYVYTNKGDKPLSYNKDLTPKQFKAVGVSISKEQGVTQELTLQEV